MYRLTTIPPDCLTLIVPVQAAMDSRDRRNDVIGMVQVVVALTVVIAAIAIN